MDSEKNLWYEKHVLCLNPIPYGILPKIRKMGQAEDPVFLVP